MTVKAKIDAIDSFVRDLKTRNLWDDIGTACVMAGWTNLAGALTPLKGSAPTNNGFLDADLDAGIGLKGDGSSYVDSNRASNADGVTDRHISVYASAATTPGTGYIGEPSLYTLLYSRSSAPLTLVGRLSSSTYTTMSEDQEVTGFLGGNRSDASTQELRAGGSTVSGSVASTGSGSNNTIVYSYNTTATPSDATLSWYSIGSATDLASLDSAVSTLMSSLRSIDEAGFDRDALSYIRRVEEADGSCLETSVKDAINQLVVGLKSDIDANGRSAWDAIGASCLLCGPRTLSGALVPLVGTAPTSYAFASGDYNRVTGLKGDGATTYLDSGRANNADGQDDNHNAVYVTTAETSSAAAYMGSGATTSGSNNIGSNLGLGFAFFRSRTSGYGQIDGAASATGFLGTRRSSDFTYTARASGVSAPVNTASDGVEDDNVVVFARTDAAGAPALFADARLAFYSIGSALDLAALDTRVTAYVAAVAAAL